MIYLPRDWLPVSHTLGLFVLHHDLISKSRADFVSARENGSAEIVVPAYLAVELPHGEMSVKAVCALVRLRETIGKQGLKFALQLLQRFGWLDNTRHGGWCKIPVRLLSINEEQIV